MANPKIKNQRLNGQFPLSYLGVNPVTPSNFFFAPEVPGTNDVQGFDIGDMWLDTTKLTQSPPVAPSTQDLYVLTAKLQGQATWREFASGSIGNSVIGTGIISSSTSAILYFFPYANAGGTFTSYTGFVMPFAGTISNLYVNVTTNGSTSSDTVTLYKNGSSTTLVATITASTTAVFSDLTHSVSVAAGDTIAFVASQSTTSLWSGLISCNFNG